MANGELRPKQKLFVKEYLIDLNATQAAIRSGYSVNCAAQIGEENLRKPDIAKEIQKAMDERSEKLAIDAEWVLRKASEVVMRCMQEIEPVMVGRGKDRTQLIDDEGRLVFCFDSTGAVAALNLVAKHRNVDAMAADRHHLAGNNGGVIVSASIDLSEAEKKRIEAEVHEQFGSLPASKD